MTTKRSIARASGVFAVVLWFVAAACALEPQRVPLLSGPSELGLSLAVTVAPDILPQDGRSTAAVGVVARDASSRPVVGLALRVETWVDGARAEFGRLSTGVMTTDSDGRAFATYRAPDAPPPVSEAPDTIVTFVVVPVGSNYASAVPRRAELRLTAPIVIYGPDGADTRSVSE